MEKSSKKIFFSIFILTAFTIGVFSIANGQYDLLGQTTASQANQNENIDFYIDWSAKTFAPTEYRGKTLPTFKSTIILSATPTPLNRNKLSENDYSFNWIIDNTITADSQLNNASFEASEGAGGEHKIYLRVFDKNRNIVKEYFFIIPITSPEVVLSEETANGLSNSVFGTIFVQAGSELNLTAKPFFFNGITKEQDLSYIWRLNGRVIKKSLVNPNMVTIAFPSEAVSGTQYNLTLSIENPLDIYQILEKNYTIKVK